MNSRATTPFGFSSTADEILEGVDLTGNRVTETGASSGIGAETARARARAGAEVTLAVRQPAAAIASQQASARPCRAGAFASKHWTSLA